MATSPPNKYIHWNQKRMSES